MRNKFGKNCCKVINGLVVSLLFIVNGCALPRVAILTDDLKKKVVLLSFQGQSDYERYLEKRLIKVLTRKCDHLVFDSIDFNPSPDRSGMSGKAITFSDWKEGRWLSKANRKGVNMVVVATVPNLEVVQKSGGFLWFRDTFENLEGSFFVSVFDTATGAKLMDKRYPVSSEIDEVDANYLQAKSVLSEGILDDVIKSWGDVIGKEICKTVGSSPFWISIDKIDRTQNDGIRVLIPAGQQVGFKKKQRLYVFDRGELIKGAGGVDYRLAGRYVGTLLVKEVAENYTEALATEDHGITIDCLISDKKR